MVETILNRKFGPKSNLFSDRRFWQYSGYRLFSGHGLALGLTGLVTVLSFVLLMVGHDQSINTFEQNTHQFQIISALVQQTKTVRIQANHFLVTQQADDFAASEAALAKLLTGFDQTLDASDPALRFNLEMVNDTTVDYFNTFRSLGELILVAHVTAVQQEIIRNLDENGAQLDQQADSILAQTASTLNESEQLMHNDSNRLRLVLLAVIIVIFAISFVGTTNATHRIARDLHTIGQAAQAIASGQFNTQVVLPRDDEIGRLGVAFNRMAESLKTSTQTETAASEQNRRQIMKLARQERVNAILEERQRIARELHDSVKQQLFSITLASGAALNLLNHEPEMARTYLEHVQQAGLYAQSEMTTLLQELVPVPLQDQRLEDALSQYLHLLCEMHSIKLLWRLEGTNTLTISQEHALFRVVQEATANVARHSQATLLRVTLNFGLQTRVIVEDNGRGFDPEIISPTSRGISTMRLRLKRVGGEFELHSVPGSGTRLEITVDLRKKVPYERL